MTPDEREAMAKLVERIQIEKDHKILRGLLRN